MAQAEPISTLRRRRGALARGLAAIRRELDEYEASGKANRLVLISCRSSFDELWKRILEVQYELDVLDEGEDARVDSLSQEHRELDVRFLGLFEQISATTPSTTNIGETRRKPEPTTVPEVRVPQFDGALENWTYFYDTFSSIVDRNESLTNVQKFQHLRSSITGRAAQSIQSLELTEANYSIALDTLKDKFNCPLHICMRHWNLMRNYPEIKKETPEALEDLLETLSVNLKALEHLKQPVTSNMAMIELIASKLPSSSLRKWQRTLPRQQVPSYQHLIDFLKTRANGTQFLSKEKESKGSAHKHHRQRTTIPHGRTLATTIRTVVCPTCNGPHEIRHCKVFKAKSATKRFQIVKKASLCINCLGRGHSLTQCTSAQIKVLNKQGQPIRARALLDTGSSMNFMTDKLANSLGIKQGRCAIQIGALDNLSTTAKRYTTATITSTDGKYKKTLRFLIIPAISTFIPSEPIDPSSLGLPRNIQLADPQFHCPAPIDVLLSTGSTFAALCIGQVNLTQPDEPELRLQKTRFGWVIGGSPASQTAINTFHATTTALQEDLARFWEIDEGPATTHLSESERLCEEHFRNHVRRTKEGRYIVALPFNEKLSSLGSSKAAAMSRLASLHRRFQRDKQYETAYSAVIQEYLDLGHMTKINTDHATDHGYYLPHHGVIKESSDTTKLRVVFDGSASSTTGVSLNDALHTGPKLQEDLRHILLRFRSFQYVLTGDIEKMYRQFILRPEDRPYQKILWRADNGEIETYRLNTVTFGLSAAPYLAIRCLKQLAEDEGPRFPRAAQILRRDFYVDDALTGADTKDEALSVRNDLTNLLKLAGLNIRKWASNDRDLLRGLPEEDTNQKLHLGESSTLKTLGVFWDSADDAILYSVKTNSDTSRVTKRAISSVIAQIYDPLGLLSPVIVRAKMIMQKVWTLKVDWDESLPTDVHTEWIKYHTQLPLLNARKGIWGVRLRADDGPKEQYLESTPHGAVEGSAAQIALHTTSRIKRGTSSDVLDFVNPTGPDDQDIEDSILD
ncbi:uncharacterized protein LOC117204925 [Bombus bifarius]|uniref:Uncharacterized protein LOC117204925 n=1 Tax=Bombus bifarius TaxID=103933 RepID=A0A6P8LEW4_9HYME|nr:uncharacterized protein LOC117204925 [Bombus bifarius]